MTQISLSKNIPLRQHGGLWEAAYHLVHPEGATLYGTDFHNISDVVSKNFGGGGTVPNIMEFSEAGNGKLLQRPNGAGAVDLRGDTVYFTDMCSGDLGITSPKCNLTPIDPDAPDPEPEPEPEPGEEIPTGCCGPRFDCPDCEPCEDAEPCNVTREKTSNTCVDYGEFCVPVIYSAYQASTFQMMGDRTDPWSLVARNMADKRSCAIENQLLNGAGQLDADGRPTFGCLGGGNVAESGHVGVINGGATVGLGQGIAQLEGALANCLCSEVGMLHLPAEVGFLACEYFYQDVVDYGDGMGERIINRSKTRGNIGVVGGGYTGAMGPDGCPCEEGVGWLYGTSMVQLVYGHQMWVPDRQFLDFDNGQISANGSEWANPTTNDVFVVGEQAIVPVYSKCCRFAVKVAYCP